MIRKLENTIHEKLTELGFVCFNRYSDRVLSFVYLNNCIYNIKCTTDKLTVARYQMCSAALAQRYESELQDEAFELGCSFYNLYVDSLINDPAMQPLCDYIKQLSDTVSSIRMAEASSYNGNNNINSIASDGNGTPCVGSAQAPAVAAVDESSDASGTRPSNGTDSSGATYAEIEPIPTDNIRCNCGYRNRSYAAFCARCGAQLNGTENYNGYTV